MSAGAVSVRSETTAPAFPSPKLSTTGDVVDPPRIQITHPFHPLAGAHLTFVVAKQLWGEDRVTVRWPDGSLRSVPVHWTDRVPPDPVITVGRGRAYFRVDDLLTLAELVRQRVRR